MSRGPWRLRRTLAVAAVVVLVVVLAPVEGRGTILVIGTGASSFAVVAVGRRDPAGSLAIPGEPWGHVGPSPTLLGPGIRVAIPDLPPIHRRRRGRRPPSRLRGPWLLVAAAGAVLLLAVAASSQTQCFWGGGWGEVCETRFKPTAVLPAAALLFLASLARAVCVVRRRGR